MLEKGPEAQGACAPPHYSCNVHAAVLADSKEASEVCGPWGLREALWFGSPVLNVWGTSQVPQRGTKINLPWSMRSVRSAVLEQSVNMDSYFTGPASTASAGLAVVELSYLRSPPVVCEWTKALCPPWLVHVCGNGRPLRAVNSMLQKAAYHSRACRSKNCCLSFLSHCKLPADALGG